MHATVLYFGANVKGDNVVVITFACDYLFVPSEKKISYQKLDMQLEVKIS